MHFPSVGDRDRDGLAGYAVGIPGTGNSITLRAAGLRVADDKLAYEHKSISIPYKKRNSDPVIMPLIGSGEE